MYYITDRKQLPDHLRGKFYETVPDGRVIITEQEVKMCPRLTDVDTFITYRDLKAYIDSEAEKQSSSKKKGVK